LLHYTNSAKFEKTDFILWSLVQKSRLAFGNWLCRSTLRYSVLALSAALLPPEQYQPHHVLTNGRACRELQAVIKRQDGINAIPILDSDVLAAFIFGVLTTYDRYPKYNPVSADKIEKAADGCMLMLKLCVKNRRRSSSSPPCVLNDFGPLILDWLEYLHLRNGDWDRWMKTFQMRKNFVDGATPFEQRVRYVHSGHAEWRSDVGRAIRFTLSLLAGKLKCILLILARKEYNGQFERGEFVKDIFESVETELKDSIFKNALKESRLWNEPIPTRYVIL
jgi:hypothetical protein